MIWKNKINSGSILTLSILSLLVCSCIKIQSNKTGERSDSDSTQIDNEVLVRGIRIYGIGETSSPPIIFFNEQPLNINQDVYGNGKALTISCDIVAHNTPNLTLQIIHCDRNWRSTKNVFIQDPVNMRSNDFLIHRAPIGVRQYDYTAEISFPSKSSLLKIEHSGNYIAQVLDYYNSNKVLAEAKFFVVEDNAKISFIAQSGFYESAQTDVPQHGFRVTSEILPDYTIFGYNIKALVLYESGKWNFPIVAEESTNEFKKGYIFARWFQSFSSRVNADFMNIPAGNEHRLLDLTDISSFPFIGTQSLTTPLSDLPRNGGAVADNNGVLLIPLIPSNEEDYIPFEFRLDLKGGSVLQDICVVGTFNDWTPSDKWRLFYDPKTGYYRTRGLIRRAKHEYEYLAGKWNYDLNVLTEYEPTLLEGNSKTSTKLFYGFVYYQDIALGSYDRIIGFSSVYTGSYK
jgi:hypothetical protein